MKKEPFKCLAAWNNFNPIPLLVLSLCFFFNKMPAHGDLHPAIEQISSQIEQQPQNARLFFKRALLLKNHGDLDPALLDFHQSLALDPDCAPCHLYMAQVYLSQGLARFSLQHVNTFILKKPNNPFAYQTRADIYQQMGEYELAISDLRKMIDLKNDKAIRPGDYLSLSEVILRAHPGNLEAAIVVLEEGLTRLGPIITIQNRLLELFMKEQDCDKALELVDEIMAPLARKQKWLLKKANLLELDGQPAEAARLRHRALREGSEGQHFVPSPKSSPLLPQHTTLGRHPASLAMETVIRGPYLQSATPNSIIIKWRTDTPTDSKVWFGTNPNNLNNIVSQNQNITEHEITLSGLTPNTKYYYTIGNMQGILAGGDHAHFFVSPPQAGSVKPVRAWILGDCGTKNNSARAVRDGYYSYVGNNYTDLILLLGDNAYSDGTDDEYQKALFENMYEGKLIQSVLWPTPGNHDYHSAEASTQTGPYFDIFSVPKNGEAGGLASGTEAYYSFNYANIHFISLDSHDSGRDPGDPMLVWLENDLNANTLDWTVVFFHHPPYSKGSHDSDSESKLRDMRENVLPILEAAGVDLVLSGHSHSYERSYLLNQHYGHSSTLTASMILDEGDGRIDGSGAYRKQTSGPAEGKGAVYTVAGSSGKVSDAPLDHPVMFYNALSLGSLSLEVTDLQLDLKFINDEGNVLDYFSIHKEALVGNPPSVSMVSPVDGAYFPTLRTITLEADATDVDGSIEQVRFLVDNAEVGVDSISPFSIDWDIPAEGAFTISAKVTDNDGNVAFSAPITIKVGAISSCSQVASSEDDAEERPGGKISRTSSDLELVHDPEHGFQHIGMRFRGLDLPQGAKITGAFLQFTVDDTENLNPCTLNIFGEANPNPLSFSSSDFDISNRVKTQATVIWSPPDWNDRGEKGPDQQTPDLSDILQEIVNDPQFSNSSEVVLMIQGSCRRTAEAYDGEAPEAPRLCVTYTPACSPTNPVIITPQAESICAGEEITLSASQASEYLWNTGDTTAEIKVRLFEETTFILTTWDEDQCEYSSSIRIKVNPLPSISFEQDSIFFCEGDSVKLEVSDEFTEYHWSSGQNTPVIMVDSTSLVSLVVVDSNNCTSLPASVAVEEQILPEISLVYVGDELVVTGIDHPEEFAFSWNTGANTPSIEVNSSGLYCVTLTDPQPCSVEECINLVIDSNQDPSPEESLQIFPNPFKNQFKIRGIKDWDSFEIILYDAIGRRLPARLQREGEDLNIWVNHAAADGIIMLHVKNGSYSVIKKMVLQ